MWGGEHPVGDLELTRREFLDMCTKGSLAACAIPALQGQGLGTLSVLVGAKDTRMGNVSNKVAKYWHVSRGTDTICTLCPRMCDIKIGERGFCGVRENQGGKYITKVYGKPATIKPTDPMEKGPFYHFLPATRTIALGTAGCNLNCKFCQSWDVAQTRPEQTDNKDLSPESLVSQALKYNIPSITFTFTEPTQCIEYLLDTAALARQNGIYTLAHTAGYICQEPLKDMLAVLDAINFDLKGFTEDFYRDMTGGELHTVLAAIQTAAASGIWMELTNLVVPSYNDDPATFREMCRWILDNCGADVPFHVSQFFPQYRLRRLDPTPWETLRSLRRIGFEVGLRYVYLGNLDGDPGESTYCPKCGIKLIKRGVGYTVQNTGLDLATGRCVKCGLPIPGLWTV